MEKHTALETSQLDTSLESESTDSIGRAAHLTRKETRQIVTPYAFFVADDLLGTPLAGPFRRGFGLLIDLFFITLLTQVSSLVLAAVAAWTFFRAGNRLKTKKRFNAARIFLRLLVALLLFIVAIGIVDEINDEINDDNLSNYGSSDASVNNQNTVGGVELVALTAKYLLTTKSMKQQIAQGKCEPAYDCLKTLGEELLQDVVDIGLDRDITDSAMEGYLGSVSESISAEQQTELASHLQQFVETKYISKNSPKQAIIEKSFVKPTENNSEKVKSYTQSKGFISWLENLVEELGLGFGWAAFYFSIFTAWWKGQTPGKKIMGMKVIKLDNTPLNLWESFGRYGGYAAGFATGLTGFLQVFWDPNRQAIQDKISETLVIDLRKPKVPFVKEKAV
jgi:hypothetical protein